jgi:hypothetical protein
VCLVSHPSGRIVSAMIPAYSGATGCIETPGLSLPAAIGGSACNSPGSKDVFVVTIRMAASTAAG